MEFEFTPGVARTIVFPIPKVDDTDFAATGDWTPITGDTKISKDAGNVANTSNNPAAVGGTGSVLWSLALTATELTAKVVVIQIVDAAVENQALVGYAKDADKIEIYTVEDTDTAPSTTVFEADRLLGRAEEASADHFQNRNVLFLTGAHQGEMSDITAYALQNSRGKFTVTALTSPAPSDGDIFMVL